VFKICYLKDRKTIACFNLIIGMLMKTLFKLLLTICLSWSVVSQAQSNPNSCQFINKSVAIDKGIIQYFKVGEGTPVVLLHGLFAQKEQWSDFACQLSKSGFAVYAPDLPGYGQSTGFPIENYQLQKEVESIHQFTKTLGLGRLHLAGNSMGGAIAALYANQYGNEVLTLGFIGAPMGVVAWSPQVKQAIFGGVNPFIPININQFDQEMSLLFDKPPELTAKMKGDAIAQYISDNRHYQQVWDIVNLDIAILDGPQIFNKPVFIMWGVEDGIFNIAGKPKLEKKYKNPTAYAIPHAAHLIMLEHTQEMADLYLQFLKPRN
jgi:pimeloyl-ACP methyl ester carboxylesterase